MASFTTLVLLIFVVITCNLGTGCTQDISYQTILRDGMEKAQESIKKADNSPLLDFQHHRASSKDLDTWINPYKMLASLTTASGVQADGSEGLGATINGYNISDACYNDTLEIFTAIGRMELWALKIIDAAGKAPSDILTGNIDWYGSFDECLSVQGVVYENYTTRQVKRTFDGQYCLANMPLQLGPMTLPDALVGICVSETCSNTDAQAIINAALTLLQSGQSKYVSCKKEVLEFDDKATGAVVMCGIILSLMIVGTAFDVIVIRSVKPRPSEKIPKLPYTTEQTTTFSCKEDEKTPLVIRENKSQHDEAVKLGVMADVLLAFSVLSNGEKILNTKMPPGSLTALNGIRFLSMSWVILGHTYSFGLSFASNVGVFYPEMMERWTFQAIINALVSVDTFFTISGLLVSYLFLREMKKTNGKMNWAMFYFHRFWRLTPPYMLVLFVHVALTRYFGNGPMWPEEGFEKDYCEDTWWTNLLYINNVVKADKMCFGWSWYLANDMQFFVVSPLMLIPLYYSQFVGIGVCVVFLIGTFIATGVISTVYDLPPTSLMQTSPYSLNALTAATVVVDRFVMSVTVFSKMVFTCSFYNLENLPPVSAAILDVAIQRSADYMEIYYYKPWCRMGPYIIGILAGFLLYKTNFKFRMHKIVNLIGWVMAAALACLVLYGLYEPMKGNYTLSTEVSALYNTVHRSIWAACICWVIFACANGYGGFVNTLMSWGGFIPLSRLTYCAYLVHPIVMFIVHAGRRQKFQMSDVTMVTYYVSFMVLAYSVAFVVSLAFESPMMGLEKALFKRGGKKKM